MTCPSYIMIFFSIMVSRLMISLIWTQSLSTRHQLRRTCLCFWESGCSTRYPMQADMDLSAFFHLWYCTVRLQPYGVHPLAQIAVLVWEGLRFAKAAFPFVKIIVPHLPLTMLNFEDPEWLSVHRFTIPKTLLFYIHVTTTQVYKHSLSINFSDFRTKSRAERG